MLLYRTKGDSTLEFCASLVQSSRINRLEINMTVNETFGVIIRKKKKRKTHPCGFRLTNTSTLGNTLLHRNQGEH